MHAKIFEIHPKNPQPRLIQQAIGQLKKGAVMVYPTDSGYALGCMLGNKSGFERICAIRNLSKRHHFTLMMRDLAHVGEYAKLDNAAFRLLKKILPGAYTFILEAARNVPNRLLLTKKKTIGLRISSHDVVQALLCELNEPMMSVSLIIEGCEFFDVDDVTRAVGQQVDVIIDSGHCPPEPTTVIDLSHHSMEIIRHGAGDISRLV